MTHGKTMGIEKPSWLPAEAEGHRSEYDIEFYRALDQASPRASHGLANWEPWRPDREFMPFAPVNDRLPEVATDAEGSLQAEDVPWRKPAADQAAIGSAVPVSDLRRAFAPIVFATAFALGLLNHGAIADKAIQFQGRITVASAESLPDAPFSLTGAWRRLPLLPGPQAAPARLPEAAMPDTAVEAPAPAVPAHGAVPKEPSPPTAPLQSGAALDDPAQQQRAFDRLVVPMALDAICDIPVLQGAVARESEEDLVQPPVIADVAPNAMPSTAAPIETAALVTPPPVHAAVPSVPEASHPHPAIDRQASLKALLRGASESVGDEPEDRVKRKVSAARHTSSPPRRKAEPAPDYAGDFGASIRAFEAIRREAP